MKPGDLVNWNGRLVVVAEIYESKCWRTDEKGKNVNWGEIPHEPFARIVVGDGDVRGVPQTDLEVISASRWLGYVVVVLFAEDRHEKVAGQDLVPEKTASGLDRESWRESMETQDRVFN